ncbi:putative orfan [Tupanvirus soda lake]|uniref:Orfan n=2 Tax=Tupanvirus TaxID=2094720 RepID=A0AC62AD62_9VIRU|nr:putative orfan [Tupanvirus soda lake]QKU35720.1 putative orfan [Tupanvirus soda lake]
MVKYWLVFSADTSNHINSPRSSNVYYSNLVICNTKEEAIDIYTKANDIECDDDEEYDAIEMKPLTADSVKNNKTRNSIKKTKVSIKKTKVSIKKTKVVEDSDNSNEEDSDNSNEEDSDNSNEEDSDNSNEEDSDNSNEEDSDNSNEEEYLSDDDTHNDILVFVMFEIDYNLDSDMNGKYFVQVNGNEDQIEKFKKINKNGDVKFNDKQYTWLELKKLREMKDLWAYDGSNDNVERLILKGKLTVPGKNKALDKNDLIEWWKKHLKSPKWPQWTNIVEEVIDLAK